MSWLVDLPRYRLSIKVVLASVLFFGMTGFKTYPLILHVSTHIPANLGDPLLSIWILMWDFHALTTNPWSLFHANIFYPVQNTLAFSEHLLGVQPLFGPVYALTGDPLMAYNVVFFLSFVFSGLTMFLLVHYWTQHFWASLLSGFLFAFTPLRFLLASGPFLRLPGMVHHHCCRSLCAVLCIVHRQASPPPFDDPSICHLCGLQLVDSPSHPFPLLPGETAMGVFSIPG